jgi:hypothetical protein
MLQEAANLSDKEASFIFEMMGLAEAGRQCHPDNLVQCAATSATEVYKVLTFQVPVAA